MSPKNGELQSPTAEANEYSTISESDATKGSSSDNGSHTVTIKTVELKREMGLAGGTSFIFGCVVGSGIFVSPTGVLDATGSVGLSLCVWLGAGLIALLASLCYSELGTMIPKSGGEYSYIQKAFGNFPAFLYTWVSVILIRPSSMATMTLTFGTYFASLFSSCKETDLIAKLMAIVCLVFILLLNSYSTKLATQLQILTTVAKFGALLVIIIGGIVKMSQGYTSEIETGFDGSTSQPATIALAFYDALWAYDGWNNLNFITEEVKNPSKNLPRSIILSVTSIIIIYGLTNLAYFSMMTKTELLEADAVAVLWGDRVLKSASILIPLSVLVSTFGSSNGSAFSGGRSVFVAARDENLPEFLSFIHVKQLTPLTSMVATMLLSIIFVLLGDISSLIDIFSFTAWVFYGATFASLIYFRFKMPDAPRPYKVPIVIPILMVLISIYLVIAPIVQNPSLEFIYAIAFILSGAVFYVPFVHFKLKLPGIDTFTTWTQLTFEVVPASKYTD